MRGEYVEDPQITPQNRGRWIVVFICFVILPLAGVFGLREMDGLAFWPSHNSLMRSVAEQKYGAVGTAGSDQSVVTDAMSPALVRQIEEITGQNGGRALIGRQVELQVPMASHANDRAFWVGTADNRILVVPERDRRDSRERQLGLVADHDIGYLESGKTAVVTGTIEPLPSTELMYSWDLTREDVAQVAALGVYLRADRITLQ